MSRSARWILPFLAIALVLGLGELVARLMLGNALRADRAQVGASVPFAEGHMLESVEQDGLRYCGRPGAHVEIFGVEYRNNSLGLRGREVKPGPHPGVYRVLVLGDSNTFGWRVAEQDTFCARAEKLLNENVAPGAERIEFVNAGIVGYNTGDQLALYRRLAPLLEPDLVLISWYYNDLDRLGFHVDADGFLFCDPLPFPDAWKPKLWRSFLYRWWSVRTVTQMQTSGEYIPGQGENIAFGETQLIALVDAIRARGTKAALIEIPWLEIGTSGDQRMRRSTYVGAKGSVHLQTWAARSALPVLQLIDSIEGEAVALCWASIDPPDHHPCARVHEKFGIAIDRFLREQLLVPR